MHDPPMLGVSHAYSENRDRIGGSRPMGVLGRRSDRDPRALSGSMGGVSEKAPLGHWRNSRQSSMGFIPENQVRTRLPAGGNRIRTHGPSRDGPSLDPR